MQNRKPDDNDDWLTKNFSAFPRFGVSLFLFLPRSLSLFISGRLDAKRILFLHKFDRTNDFNRQFSFHKKKNARLRLHRILGIELLQFENVTFIQILVWERFACGNAYLPKWMKVVSGVPQFFLVQIYF